VERGGPAGGPTCVAVASWQRGWGERGSSLSPGTAVLSIETQRPAALPAAEVEALMVPQPVTLRGLGVDVSSGYDTEGGWFTL
jgi:hypothetical protein